MDWNKILNWRLLSGPHKFPGPDGGTCINEAAIVAAGFEYRAVQSADDCPPCFSRTIALYALRLNDVMPDDLRQRLLMPFVVRLAGTADASRVEKKRAQLIALRTIKEILPIALRAVGLDEHAKRCAGARNLAAAKSAAYTASAAATACRAAAAAYTAYASRLAAAAASEAAPIVAGNPREAAASATSFAAVASADADTVFGIAASILDEAIRLGNHAEPPEAALVQQRMTISKREQTPWKNAPTLQWKA